MIINFIEYDFAVVLFIMFLYGFGIVGSILIGCFCLSLGYQLFFKEKITLLNSSYYSNISENDRKSFCRMTGIGLFLVGLGFLVSDIVLLITFSLWSLFVLAIGIFMGVILLIYAKRKYSR